MSARAWSDEQLRQVYEWRQEGKSWTWIADETNDHSELKARFSHARQSGRLARVLGGTYSELPTEAPSERLERHENEDGTLSVAFWDSERITTVEQMLAAFEVDLKRWEVSRARVGFSEVTLRGQDGEPETRTNYNGKAELRPIPGIDAALAFREELLADVAAHAPRYAPVQFTPPTGERHMLEVCLMDLHIGMLAWHEETGADFDSDLARQIAAESVAALVRCVEGFPIERVLFPLGNDLTHADRTIDGAGGATHRGTSLDVDTRRARMVRMTRMVAVETIDTLRQVAPVDVVIVPGNHDHETAFALGEVVQAWYRNDDAVTVNNAPAPRKYARYGTTLIGLAHGHGEKIPDLPLLMATEAAGDWPEVTHREWHIGHRHAKREWQMEEFAGVRVRVMPSLAGEDAWHASKGYRHMRAAEAYLWEFDRGYRGHFSVGVPAALMRSEAAA